jgi:hypothetical protein
VRPKIVARGNKEGALIAPLAANANWMCFIAVAPAVKKGEIQSGRKIELVCRLLA